MGVWLLDFINNELKKRNLTKRIEVKRVVSDSPNLASSIVLVYIPVNQTTDKTIVMCGHIDTVGVEEYGDLAEEAGNIDLLKLKLPELVGPEIVDVIKSEGTLVGRGTLDMKGSDAVMLELLLEWAASEQSAPLALILVCDEEDNSRGAKTAIPELQTIMQSRNLTPIMLLNGDYTSPRYTNDHHRYLYTGTIGKLLIAINVYGETCHVGQSTEGIGAGTIMGAIATELDLNPSLAEVVDGVALPLPTWLHTGDTRQRYDVKIPEESVGYLNFFYVNQSPSDILIRVKHIIESAIDQLLVQRKSRFNTWTRMGGEGKFSEQFVKVCTVSDLVPASEDSTEFWSKVAARKKSWPVDSRQYHFELVAEALKQLAITQPIIVVGFAPPFYPASYTPNHLIWDVEAQLKEIEPELRYQPIYPYISDMSWFAEVSEDYVKQITECGPAFTEHELFQPPIKIPVIDLGPIGFGAHQLTENVDKNYLLFSLPKLMSAIISRLSCK